MSRIQVKLMAYFLFSTNFAKLMTENVVFARDHQTNNQRCYNKVLIRRESCSLFMSKLTNVECASTIICSTQNDVFIYYTCTHQLEPYTKGKKSMEMWKDRAWGIGPPCIDFSSSSSSSAIGDFSSSSSSL
jgi:hypothetical protein